MAVTQNLWRTRNAKIFKLEENVVYDMVFNAKLLSWLWLVIYVKAMRYYNVYEWCKFPPDFLKLYVGQSISCTLFSYNTYCL